MKTIKTKVGQAGWTDHRYFGYSVFNDLSGKTSTTGLIALAATGRKLNKEDCKMLDEVAVILSVADPRIYPLKLVRLASSWSNSLAGLSAAITAMNGAIVGPQISQDAAYWLTEIGELLKDKNLDSGLLRKIIKEQFETKGRISGFGVPFRNIDERATALTKSVKKRDRDKGYYWKLQEAIANLVLRTRNLATNVGLPIAALSLDMGLSPEHLSSLYTGLTINVFLANAVEGASKAPSILRCLPASSVKYIGRAPRKFNK